MRFSHLTTVGGNVSELQLLVEVLFSSSLFSRDSPVFPVTPIMPLYFRMEIVFFTYCSLEFNFASFKNTLQKIHYRNVIHIFVWITEYRNMEYAELLLQDKISSIICYVTPSELQPIPVAFAKVFQILALNNKLLIECVARPFWEVEQLQ